MSATTMAERGRSRAETLMVDTCTITRKGAGAGTFNPATGETAPPARTTVYTGRCWVKARDVGSQVQLVADQPISLMTYIVSIPYETTGVRVGDLVSVTASLDPGLVGRDLDVKSEQVATYAVARRLVCTDNQG